MSSSTFKQGNYLEVIKDLEDFYTENAVSVSTPVANITLSFKPLSVAQLKKFIELQVATQKDEFGVIPGLKTVQQINQVLVDNCLDKSADVLNNLTVLDRDAVIVQLRANVKSTAEVAAGDDETETIDLTDIVSRIKSAKFNSKLKVRTKTFKFGSSAIKVKMRLPSLQIDNMVNEDFLRKIKPKLQKGKKQVEKDVEKILSQVFFLEICKYIETVEVGGETITFEDPTHLDANLDLLEKLPTKVVSEVSSYLSEIKQYKDSTMYYTNLENKDIPLDVDVALFTGI